MFPWLGSKVVYQGRIPRPKAGFPMFGTMDGSKGLFTGFVHRFGFEVCSRGNVSSIGPKVGAHGWGLKLGLKYRFCGSVQCMGSKVVYQGKSQVLVPRQRWVLRLNP